ncbi:sulfur carrier protein ThiS [Helicobacter himalayensis]|uniref:sulfur carrier protein ThiS n=1 Tax=Helicobacter himalayensis TaxID=1591088 RepID=UPI0008299F01|nr:sulfur carrier protein ThiS [Helicobacter himalayensis]
MAHITLNGESYECNASTIEELVVEVGASTKAIALAQNMQVVHTKNWAQTPIKENDEIEILQFVGGG